MTAREQLAVALARMVDDGGSTPCAAAGDRLWLSDRAGDREAAVRLCNGCPVFAECGEAADEVGESFGVWGGRDRTAMPERAQRVSRSGSRSPVVVPGRLRIGRSSRPPLERRRPLLLRGTAGLRLTPDRRGGAA